MMDVIVEVDDDDTQGDQILKIKSMMNDVQRSEELDKNSYDLVIMTTNQMFGSNRTSGVYIDHLI